MGKKTLRFSSLLAPLNLMLVPRVLGFRGWLPSQRDHYTHFCLSRPESEIIFLHSRDSGKEREGARRGMSWLNNKNGSLKKKTKTNSYSKFPFVKDWFPAILCFNTGNWREFLPRLSRSQTTQSTQAESMAAWSSLHIQCITWCPVQSCAKAFQLCSTVCDPMDHSPPGSFASAE